MSSDTFAPLTVLRNLLEPNPVLVRELKQFVRNRLLLWFMLCYLLLLSLVAIIAMVEASLLSDVESFTLGLVSFRNDSTGVGLFRFILVSYYTFTSVFLVLFGAIKMGFERLNNDLGYYTTLPSWRVISGKFLLGVVVSFLFLSIGLPFLTIAYMMRGVGFDVMAYSAIYFYLYTLIQYSVTLAFFSGAKTLKRVYVFALTLLLIQGMAWFIGFGFSWGYMSGEFTKPQYAWSGFCIEAIFLLMPLPLAVCQVSPESANRMLPIRLATTCTAFLMVLSVFLQFLNVSLSWGYDGLENLFFGLGFCCYFCLPYIILIGICEREQYTIRQRLRIPKNPFWRVLCFPFSTGAMNAIAWMIAYLLFLGGFYLFLQYVVVDWVPYSGIIDLFFVDEVLKTCVPFAILMFDYAVTAFLLWKIVLHRFISREWLAFGVLGLSIGFYLTIMIIEIFGYGYYQYIRELVAACFFLPVVLGYGANDSWVLLWQTFLAIAWGTFLLVILVPLQLHAFRRFVRYEGTQLSPPEQKSQE